MTSTEAAALLLSGGKTTDVEEANLMESGQLLDPDALERAYYRRIFGFDFTTYMDNDKHKIICRDEDLDITVTGTLASDTDKDAQTLARLCMKLKRLHEKAVKADA